MTDALNATKAAVEEGIVPGMQLLHFSRFLSICFPCNVLVQFASLHYYAQVC